LKFTAKSPREKRGGGGGSGGACLLFSRRRFRRAARICFHAGNPSHPLPALHFETSAFSASPQMSSLALTSLFAHNHGYGAAIIIITPSPGSRGRRRRRRRRRIMQFRSLQIGPAALLPLWRSLSSGRANLTTLLLGQTRRCRCRRL